MNDKNFKRHMAYEALVILGLLALLTYITRLWPILLLIILGIFIATLRLLFLSSKKVEPVKPVPALPSSPQPPQPPQETDMQSMAYAIIQRRITQILQGRFPEVRWIWENPKAKEDIMIGNPVYVLLNRAGGYRRGRVVIQNLTVMDIVFEEEKPKADPPTPNPGPASGSTPPPEENDEEESTENFGLIAFQWVEAHVMELNDRCNEAIAEGLSEYLIPADDLPVTESWEEICKELVRNEFRDARCCDDGIIIYFEQ